MMERQNVLSLKTIKELFNRFIVEDRRFFRDDLLDAWIQRPDSKKRLFGTTRSAYIAMAEPAKRVAQRQALRQMQDRYAALFQRRHDCIHNCDRPRVSPQSLTLGGTVLKVIDDVEFLVHRCNEHINTEFRDFLLGTGCTVALITQVGY